MDSTVYNLDSTDTYLFGFEFRDFMSKQEAVLYRQLLYPVFARDIDTPLPVLKRIAEDLDVYIKPSFGYYLPENPKVRADREILTVMSHLPVVQGDGYLDIRERCKQLLSQL